MAFPSISDAVVLLVDDPKSIPERRALFADIINTAVDKGARAVVFDVFFTSPTGQDAKLLKAIQHAKERGVKIFMVAPPDGEKPFFEDNGIILGHNLAIAYGYEYPPNPTAYVPRKTIGGASLPLISLAVAMAVCDPKKVMSKIPPDPETTKVSYKDLTGDKKPMSFSYNDYLSAIKAGSIIFVGGSVAPGTGAPADVVVNDAGEITNGVFDAVSAFFSLCSDK